MKWLIILFSTAYIICIDAASLRNEPQVDKNMTIPPDDIFIEENIIYRGQYDIVDLYLPLFLMGKYENYKRMIFFVESGKSDDRAKVSSELYVKINEDPVHKLLDNCRDIEGDGLGNVYFASDDGIYVYNKIKNTGDKFSTISDSFISIGPENNTGIVHALNSNHVLYTITMNGTKSEVNDRIKDAQEIAVNIKEDNIYYYDANKNANVLTKDGNTIRIKGLPENPTYFKMIKAPFVMDGILFMVNNDIYNAFSNGTSTLLNLGDYRYIPVIKPTAYSVESNLVLYFGHEKKIYEYNFIEKIVKTLADRVLDKIAKSIEEIFTKV